MNKKYALLSLLILTISSCSNNNPSIIPSIDTSSSTSSESTSSEIVSSEIISSSEEISSEQVSSSEELPTTSRNPMNEPLIHNQYYLNHIGDIYNTWKSYKGAGITIAVIDEGFKYDHEDFYYEDGTSKVSDLSASFKTSGTSTTKEIGRNKISAGTGANAHGTFCAGVAAAGINGKGVIGIAPLAKLLLLKTDKHPYSIREAFKYAADNGAKVITISIGSYANYDGDLEYYKGCGIDLTTVFNDAIDYCRNKNVAVISASGNGGLDSRHQRDEYTYPGAVNGVIGAGGLADNKSDVVWDGSSYNSSPTYQFCDVFAPADGMFGCTDHIDKGVTYTYAGGWNGTSFASPIVAGIAALYFEKYPNHTVNEFESDLYNSCHKFTSSPLTITNIGAGRVDAGNLLGTTLRTNVTVKLINSGNINAYIWNSVTGAMQKAWPGTELIPTSGNNYSFNVDTNNYDSIIFNDEGIQTVDIYISSFSYNNTYNLDVEYESGLFIGQYISN